MVHAMIYYHSHAMYGIIKKHTQYTPITFKKAIIPRIIA